MSELVSRLTWVIDENDYQEWLKVSLLIYGVGNPITPLPTNINYLLEGISRNHIREILTINETQYLFNSIYE